MEASLAINIDTFNEEPFLKRLNVSVAIIKKDHHRVMQACTWSGTPGYHKQCVTAMIDIVIPVSSTVPQACRLQSCPGEGFKTDEKVTSAFASVAKDRNNKTRGYPQV
jgi:hypothetical protein